MPSQSIKPKRPPFRPDAMRRVVSNTMTAIAKDIKVDYDVTTQTWEHRPDVEITGSGPDERQIKVKSDIYAMLEAGTRPHMIKPKKMVTDKRTGKRRRVRLHFTTPFQSKTLPNRIMSRGGDSGDKDVYARGVRHPGTKPRNWSKVIAAKWRKEAPQVMARAIAAEYR